VTDPELSPLTVEELAATYRRFTADRMPIPTIRAGAMETMRALIPPAPKDSYLTMPSIPFAAIQIYLDERLPPDVFGFVDGEHAYWYRVDDGAITPIEEP
jgi:hypothetical protein